MNKYWRLKRDDKELDDFIVFLKREYSYKEKRSNHMYPSKISTLDLINNKVISPKSTIIVILHSGFKMSNFLQKFSEGHYLNSEREKTRLIVEWIEDRNTINHKITNFSIKMRKEKIKKLNEINSNKQRDFIEIM